MFPCSCCRTMPIPTTISCASSSKFLSSRCLGFNSARLKLSKANSPAKRAVFSNGLVAKMCFSKRRVWTPDITNKQSTRALVFDNGGEDEGVRVLEQETLIDGSAQIGSNFSVYQMETILNHLSKWFVGAFFCAVIVWRHDAEAMWAAKGSFINAILSFSLKKILNQERPVPGIKSDPGMPSSHAQSIFFAVFFVILSIIEWLGINGYSITFSGLVLALGSYLSWLRVSQQLHTVNQVVVGAIVGSIFSILWYWLWGSFVQEAFVSSLVVQVIVITGAIGFCASLLVHRVCHWLKHER